MVIELLKFNKVQYCRADHIYILLESVVQISTGERDWRNFQDVNPRAPYSALKMVSSLVSGQLITFYCEKLDLLGTVLERPWKRDDTFGSISTQ